MSQGRYVSGELVRSVYVVNMSSGGGSGTPGGSNTQIQFNNAGVFGGVANSSVNNATGNITLGNRVSVPLGTAALPSIYPGTDTNTGIYSPGADQLAVATNGTGRLFINATGNVGIGTTSPTTPLEIASSGTANALISAFDATASRAYFQVGGTTSGRYTQIGTDTSTTFINDYFGTGIAFQLAASEKARIDSLGRLLVGTSSARAITGLVQKIQTEDATGSGSGRIAIGTNNNLNNTGPGIFFFRSRGGALGSNTIVQNDDLVGSLFFQGADGTDINSRAAEISAVIDGTPGANDMPGCLVFSTTADGASSPTERLRINSSGNVGIGTSLPGATLEVAGSARFFGGSGTDGLLTIGSTGASNDAVIIKYDNANDRLQFYNWGASGSNQNTFVIDNANSRVGINTASPANLLDVASAQGDGIRIGSSPAGTITRESEGLRITGVSTNKNISFVTAGTEACRIDTSGRLLVGTSTSTSVGGSAATVQIFGTGGNPHSLQLTRGDAPVLVFGKTDVGGGANCLGAVVFAGNDTNDLNSVGATIGAFVDGTIGVNDLPTRLVFSTTSDGANSPTERMRITSDAYVRLAAGTGGIQFNGDTAAANALDDYEEGTWTPLPDAVGAITQPIYTSSGRYLKIGKLVYLTGNISVTTASTGAVSQSRITGIPFNMGGSGSGLADYQPQFTVGAYSAVSSSAADSSTPTGAYVYEFAIFLRSLFGSTAGGQVNHGWSKVGVFNFSLTYYLL
jgi:hypothetical protein